MSLSVRKENPSPTNPDRSSNNALFNGVLWEKPYQHQYRKSDIELPNTTGRTRHVSKINSREILETEDDMRIFMLKTIIEEMTGRKINIVRPEDFQKDHTTSRSVASQPGFDLIYKYEESLHESEAMEFHTQASILTADGQKLDVAIDLRMSREFMETSQMEIQAGNAALIDPLVINWNGSAAELTGQKISFDLDMDGKEDQISFVKPGNGFLVLDKNEDGRINNGSELFGPTLGNGFQELAIHDEDQNGWMDENDQIFNKLRIWTKDDAGNDRLFALGKAGVGAIYLGHADTPFQIKDTSNELHGKIRTSGIYISENGKAGTIQQIDLAL